MAKVLVVRKPDGTQRAVSLDAAPAIKAHSNRLPEGQKWEFEEMDEDELPKDEKGEFPYLIPDFKTPAEAKQKAKALEAELSQRDQLIADLQAQLNAKNAAPATLTAPQLIEKINAAGSAEEVKSLLGTD